MIRTHAISITTSGSAGSATGSGDTSAPVNGRVLAIHVDLMASPGTTTDITISTKNAPTQTIITLTNVTADAWYYPRQLMDGVTGADLTAIYEALAVDDYVSASIAQANAGAFTITLLVEV